MRNKHEKSGTINMDSENSDYKRSSNNFTNRANPSDNPQTGIDDDDDFNVEDIEDEYNYEDDVDDQVSGIEDYEEYEDIEHDHAYSVPVAENDDDYYNENRPQDDRF